MKKTLSIVLCLCMVLSLCSCGKKQDRMPDIDEKTGKKIITIASTFPKNSGNVISNYIVAFNKANDEYTAVQQKYADVSVDEWIKSGCDQSVLYNAVAKLNAEMVTGKVPDVIICDSKIPVYSYVQKGILADMYEFMENDPTFNKDDYLQSAFKVSEIDGKLFEIFPRFWIVGTLAKTSEVGESISWTTTEFYDYVASKPNSKYIDDTLAKREFLVFSIQTLFNNYDASKFDFNPDDFMQILKAAEFFPTEDAYSDVNFNYDDFQANAKNGDPLMLYGTLMDFRSLKIAETAFFGEAVTLKNFPTAKGATPCLRPHDSLLITNNSKNQAGAWEFVKFAIDNPNPDDLNYSFPVKLSLLNELAESAKKNPYDTDEKYVYYGNSTSFEIDNNTDEDNAKIMNILNNTNTIWRYDENIAGIINEEVDFFLSGQKSAEEFIHVVQNRVNLYIEEMK